MFLESTKIITLSRSRNGSVNCASSSACWSIGSKTKLSNMLVCEKFVGTPFQPPLHTFYEQ